MERGICRSKNSFIAQYCAAKEQDWADISLDDMKSILRIGKSNLYFFTRTTETQVVEADDPDTEDVAEAKDERWYIYTIVITEKPILQTMYST